MHLWLVSGNYIFVEKPVILKVIPEPYLMLQNTTEKGVEL